MGYIYDWQNRLCCDNCGVSGGVRKRTCTYKVLGDSLRGPRYALPYCSPPALCSACFATCGGSKGLHSRCKEGAAQMQAKADAVEAALDAGEALVIAGWGSWHETVPDGMTGVCFASRTDRNIYRLVPADQYVAPYPPLSAFTATDWVNHPGAATKQVTNPRL